jgi:GTP pyrophosphokinase
MVQVREEYSFNADGRVNFEQWLARLESYVTLGQHDDIRRACDLSWNVEQQTLEAGKVWSPGVSSYRTGLEMAEILAQLHLDADAIIVALLYRPVRESKLSLDQIREAFGKQIAILLEGVLRMAAINETDTSNTRILGQSQDKMENVRKMLLAMIDDVRVALIKLAERTCAIRSLKTAGEEKRRRVAREVFDIYAPLAHRLGIGQLKWELEDLSFRYLQPENYKRIASLLDERRLDRERFITEVTEELRRQFNRAGIDAEINGRAKSIYSIWRKMQRKQLDFNQIFDIRAVRVMVPDARDCYAALGIVHNLWRVIPNEFDDYIANPKENGYQSLHTAVIGPDNKVFEIQIRTFAMDDDAELGVCAHWRYKEGIKDPDYRDGFDEKIEWLRQVLAWHDEMGMVGGLAEQLRSDAGAHDRIYVFTPEGHVVDLMAGATPLDFAYYVHTQLGNHCSGARVNDKLVSLNCQLKTGDRVEVLSSELNEPSREWLKPHLGYVNTPRARAKIVQWFKSQSRVSNITFGKQWIESEFKRLALRNLPVEEIARKLGCRNLEGLYVSVGTGAIGVDEVIETAQQLSQLSLEHDLFADETDARQVAVEGSVVVYISIVAYDRPGLLRDISTILTNENIDVVAVNTRTDKRTGTASLRMEIEVHSFHTLARALNRLTALDSVIEAERVEEAT